jgi:hypothetical protein
MSFYNPLAFLCITAFLVVVSLMAILGPALKAISVDPLVALRRMSFSLSTVFALYRRTNLDRCWQTSSSPFDKRIAKAVTTVRTWRATGRAS